MRLLRFCAWVSGDAPRVRQAVLAAIWGAICSRRRDEFETRLAQTGGLGALQLLDGVVQTPRRLETSTLRETISQKTQEGRESKLLRGPPHQTAQLIFGCETLRTQALFQAARIVSP